MRGWSLTPRIGVVLLHSGLVFGDGASSKRNCILVLPCLG
jgi:hypothetical protein